jgi:hypothetical protein
MDPPCKRRRLNDYESTQINQFNDINRGNKNKRTYSQMNYSDNEFKNIFLNGRHNNIHIIEPYWNNNIIQQEIRRGVRMNSFALYSENDKPSFGSLNMLYNTQTNNTQTNNTQTNNLQINNVRTNKNQKVYVPLKFWFNSNYHQEGTDIDMNKFMINPEPYRPSFEDLDVD